MGAVPVVAVAGAVEALAGAVEALAARGVLGAGPAAAVPRDGLERRLERQTFPVHIPASR